jgi:hypothetical protein
MGDRHRFREFASFIHRTFPDAKPVADVAGGHGELACWLDERGKEPVIIEPREAAFPRWVQRTLRTRAARTGHLASKARLRTHVPAVDLRTFDLIVALHPDAATEPTLRAAVAHSIDIALVPCCVFPLDGIKRSMSAWLTYLAALAPDVHIAALPIVGANVVLGRRGGGSTTSGGNWTSFPPVASEVTA